MELPGNRGKYLAFDHDRALQILDWTEDNAEHNMAITKTEIKDDYTRQF
jgi:hypothetical protein